MIIGDRGRFAIEFQVDEPRLEHWLFGKLCYRVGGQEVGDYDLGGTLNGAVGAFIRLLEFKGSRQEPTLMSSPAADVFNRIDGALYIDSGQSDLQVRTDWESFKRFHAWPVGFDVFDGWKCYLIEDDKIGRFLWKDCRPGGGSVVSEAILSAGEFDSVVLSFVQHMQSTYPECGGREEVRRLVRSSGEVGGPRGRH